MNLPDVNIDLVVFDFDGVFTDNAVWVTEDDTELVRCNRGDGWGIARMHDAGVAMLVLSTEINPVVTTRCRKLRLDVEQGLADKGARLAAILADRGIDPRNVIYVGNDENDAGCLRLAGTAIVVADSHPSVLPLADIVLSRNGGAGAVRELCDAILLRRLGEGLVDVVSAGAHTS